MAKTKRGGSGGSTPLFGATGPGSRPGALVEGGQRLEGLAASAMPLLSFIPGLRDFIKSPWGQSIMSRNEGQRLTDTLSGVRPKIGTVDTQGGMGTVEGPQGSFRLNLPTIGRQSLTERQAAFDALSQLGAEQGDVTDQFRANLDSILARGGALDQELQGLGMRTAGIYNTALQQVRGIGRKINAYIAASTKVAGNLLKEIRTEQADIRKNFNNEVSGRMEALSTGIDAESKNAYDTHVRAIEATGGALSADERASLEMVYRRDGARTKAMAMGELFEVTSQQRAQLETNLNATFTSAAETTVTQVAGLAATGINATVAAEQVAADLSKAKAQSLLNIQSERRSLMELTGLLSIDGHTRLFEMVTDRARPVMVFSDVLSGLVDTAWDAIAFNNQAETMRLANEMSIQNPLHAGAFESFSIWERDSFRHSQVEAQERAEKAGTVQAGLGIIPVIGGAIGQGYANQQNASNSTA